MIIICIVKRAVRALESDSYKKRQGKVNSRLPPVASQDQALQLLRQLPLQKLAFQAVKLDTDDAISKGLKPRPGVPVLQISPQQQFLEDQYVVWFYEPVSLLSHLYAVLAVAGIFAVVLFPLWPLALRRGVWYLSMGLLGLIAAFFGLAIVRLILFMITYVVVKPGIWIFPNLFEDLGVLDSFVPLWSWHGADAMRIHRLAKKKKKSKQQKARKLEKQRAKETGGAGATGAPAAGAPAGGMPGVNPQLLAQLQKLNARIQAISAEREKAGKPMAQEEVQKLGQALIAEYMGPLQSGGAAAPGGAQRGAPAAASARPAGNRTVKIEEIEDED